MRLKKSIRLKKSRRVNTSARLKKVATRLTAAIGAGTMALVTMCVIAAAMLIALYQPSQPANSGSVATERQHAAAMAAGADLTAANEPAAESAAAVPTKPAPVTITGCLERADQTFRLKDTAGVNAPKSRSWKSGFLRKGSASIEVVDAANRLKLPAHVGQRVSVTGTLVDREMHVRSLQLVTASCTNSPRVRI